MTTEKKKSTKIIVPFEKENERKKKEKVKRTISENKRR